MFQLSTQLLQAGQHDQLARVMEVKERTQRLQAELAEAELDEEEAQHARLITSNINDDAIRQAKDIHLDTLEKVTVMCSDNSDTDC